MLIMRRQRTRHHMHPERWTDSQDITCALLTARIFLLSNLSSAVQYMMFHIFIFIFTLHRYITNSQYDQRPVGLIAQLVVSTVLASQRSWARIPFKPEFFQAFFSQLLKLRTNCEELSSIQSFIRSSVYDVSSLI